MTNRKVIASLSREIVEEFERLRGQLKVFYDEISTLSKKNPDGAMNKFKLGFINDPLKKMTALLGEPYRPFPHFEAFSEDEMPTTSDVGMMLSQYLNSMSRFETAHTRQSTGYGRVWDTSEGNIRAEQFHYWK